MELIAAVDQNWGLGAGGRQSLYIPEDLRRFRALTWGRTVILGRRTLEALPGGCPLPGRRNLILSRTLAAVEGAEVFRELEALLERAPEDAVVIGGASVYRALLPRCRTAYLTKIEASLPADVWLPNLDADPLWSETDRSPALAFQGIPYRYVVYRRS